MATSEFLKVNSSVPDLQKAVYRLALTNTAPSAASTVWSEELFPPPAAANGYPPDGVTPTVISERVTTGQFKLVLDDVDFVAADGGLGPFQYVVLYCASNGNSIIGYYDYGASLTLAPGEKLTIDFDRTNGVFTSQIQKQMDRN